MASIQLWFGGVVVFCLLAPPIMTFSHGASHASCKEMVPGHIRAHPLDPKHSYVTVQTSTSSYLPGQLITVMVRSSRDFMGFLLQARTVGGVKRRRYGRGAGIRSRRFGPLMAGGSWILTPPGTHTLHCLSENDAITHSDKQPKRNLSFVWRAPDVPMGDIRFFLTVVQSYFIYWARVESAVVHDGSRSVWSSDEITAVDGESTVYTVQEERVTAPPGVNSSSKIPTNWTRTTLKPTNGGSQTLSFLKTQAEFHQTALRPDNSVTLKTQTSTTNTWTLGSLQIDTHTTPEPLSGVSKETTCDTDFPPKSSIPRTSSNDSADDGKMDPTTGPISQSNSPLLLFPLKGKGTQRNDPKIKSQEPKLKTKSETKTPETSAPLISKMFRVSNTPSENQTGSLQEEISSTFETQRTLENIQSWSQTSKVKEETGLLFQTSSTKLNISFQTDTSWTTFLSKTQTISPKTQTTSPKTQTTSPKIQITSPKTQTTSPKTQTTSPKIQITSPKTQTTSPKTQTTSPKTQTTSPKTQTTSPKTQTTSPKSAFPSKSPTFETFQVLPITQTKPQPETSPSGPKGIKQPTCPQNTLLSGSPESLFLSSFHQTSSESQFQMSAVKTETGLLSRASSTEPNLPFQTQTSPISLLLETFTPKTQTLLKSIFSSKSPTFKYFRVTLVTQTKSIPGTSTSGPKSTSKQTRSPQTTMSTRSPSQRQSGVNFHQVQSETVPTQPSLLWRDQSQSEVPEETLRTSPQPQSQTLFQTGQTLSPRPIKHQSLEKNLKSEAKMKTVSPVFDFVGSFSSFDSLDGSSGPHPSDTSPLYLSFKSTIHSSSSSSEDQPKTIPVSTSPHPSSAQRSSSTDPPPFLTSSIVQPSNSNHPSNSSISSVLVSTPLSFNSSKCFTSCNFSLSSTSKASQSVFSSTLSPQTQTFFASSPTLPPPSASSTPTSSSFTSITTPHPGPSSSPHYFLQTSFMTSVPSKKTTVGQRSVIHTHLTSSSPELNLGSIVHPNPKPFPNHKLNRGQESKPNVPNTDAKPKRPSSPSNTPDREEKYPDINPRHSSWELGMLLGCSAGLGMVLVVGVRYVYRQACGRRTEVTLNDREREYGRGLIQVQECGDLVRVRKIRENSFVLLTEYDVLAPPEN